MDHIISARQFNTARLNEIFNATDQIRYDLDTEPRELAMRHLSKRVITLFYEPSTRTRLSFESAAHAIGAGVISTENAGEFSSAIKNETLEDTIKTVANYGHVIIMRHGDDDSAERAALVSEVPVINAGAGKNEHPTQALLDLYTILKTTGQLEHLNVVIGGDLKHGRTARSLAQLLSLYPFNKLTFVSTPDLQIEDDITRQLTAHGTEYSLTDDLHSALPDADVVYWTRLQTERMQDKSIMSHFSIGQSELAIMKDDSTIMHPLPRVNEIDPSVDNDPRARYFDQVKYGFYLRAALLDGILKSPNV